MTTDPEIYRKEVAQSVLLVDEHAELEGAAYGLGKRDL